MKTTVLLDLGNTLVRYYTRLEFSSVLQRCVAAAGEFLGQRNVLASMPADLSQRLAREDYESPDHRVRPLEGRLTRLLSLDPTIDPELLGQACRRFCQPILQMGRLYDDVIPVLGELRAQGYRTAVLSNTPWGSPAEPWREELKRLGLSRLLEAAVFCRDAGWRKPARQLFDFALQKLQVTRPECLMVGDDPRWDVAGAEANGIDAVLLDRARGPRAARENTIGDLRALLGRLARGRA